MGANCHLFLLARISSLPTLFISYVLIAIQRRFVRRLPAESSNSRSHNRRRQLQLLLKAAQPHKKEKATRRNSSGGSADLLRS
jgi:hypothetical protein